MLSTVLIVDDDPNVADAIATGLQRPGRRLIVCSDAESASLVVDSTRLDAVVTDIKLSDAFHYEGIDLLLRVHERAPGAVAIGMSGDRMDGLSNAIRSAGAAFLSKPFELEEIERMLPECEGAEETAI